MRTGPYHPRSTPLHSTTKRHSWTSSRGIIAKHESRNNPHLRRVNVARPLDACLAHDRLQSSVSPCHSHFCRTVELRMRTYSHSASPEVGDGVAASPLAAIESLLHQSWSPPLQYILDVGVLMLQLGYVIFFIK